MNKKLFVISMAALLLSSLAQASLPWCTGGKIVKVAKIKWTEGDILANFNGTVPSSVVYVDIYIATKAMEGFAATFAGGGGSYNGWTALNNGEVKTDVHSRYYADPHSTSVPPPYPGNYDLSQGLSFSILKCFTIPPLVGVVYNQTPSSGRPTNPTVEPFQGLQAMREYWKEPAKEAPAQK